LLVKRTSLSDDFTREHPKLNDEYLAQFLAGIDLIFEEATLIA
jgi:hypothetical protein